MADSEVRQKFEAYASVKYYASRCSPPRDGDAYLDDDVQDAWLGFAEGHAAGMRAGEIARSEKVKEGACQDCGRENPVWFADNDVWNAVLPDRVGFLCPICFIRRADPIIKNTGWKLIPEQLDALPAAPEEK